MQRYHYHQYLVNRDDNRQRRNAPPRWIHNCTALMVSLTHAKQRRSIRAINTVCSHPAQLDQRILLKRDQRILLKRDIDLHFLCFRHTILPPAQRWISLLMQYTEKHLWEDSERAGDIWNGRWSQQLLSEILIEHSDTQIPQTDYSSAMQWLSNITLILQKTQTAKRIIPPLFVRGCW